MKKSLAVLLLLSLLGCADWHAFLQCKYALFQPCPPTKDNK